MATKTNDQDRDGLDTTKPDDSKDSKSKDSSASNTVLTTASATPAEPEGNSNGDDTGATDDSDDLAQQLAGARDALKAANSEAAKRRIALNAAEKKLVDLQRKDMDEVERLKAELNDAKGAATQQEELQQSLDAMSVILTEQVTAMFADLNVPNHVKKLLEVQPVSDQLQYLIENREEFGKKKKPPKTNINASGKTTSGVAKPTPDQLRTSKIRRRKGAYSRM